MIDTHLAKTGTTHALLIGVDDYTSFNGNHKYDLKGGRNDVVLLAFYCVNVLGVPLENVHLLTSPPITDADVARRPSLQWLGEHSEVYRGQATEKEVTERLATLLGFATEAKVLLAFSGHGAVTPDGPVLCLGDTAPGFASGVLSLKTLREDIEKAGAKDKLIALFDCCHVASPSAVRSTIQVKSLPHTVTDAAPDPELFQVSDRVLLAAEPGKAAYQMRPGTQWHGMFTFALATAASQWKGEEGVSHGAYEQVLKRAKRTLKALGAKQKPQLLTPETSRFSILKQPFLGVEGGHTEPEPDGLEIGTQINPDFFYTIFIGQSVLAQIVATGPIDSNRAPVVYGGAGIPPGEKNGTQPTVSNTEYWYVNTAALARLDIVPTPAITITAQSMETSAPPFAVTLDGSVTFGFSSAEARSWTGDLAAPTTGTNFYFRGKPAAAPKGTTAAFLVLNRSGTSSDFRFGAVQWYLMGLSSRPDGSSGVLQPGPTDSTGATYLVTSAPKDDYWGAASL